MLLRKIQLFFQNMFLDDDEKIVEKYYYPSKLQELQLTQDKFGIHTPGKLPYYVIVLDNGKEITGCIKKKDSDQYYKLMSKRGHIDSNEQHTNYIRELTATFEDTNTYETRYFAGSYYNGQKSEVRIYLEKPTDAALGSDNVINDDPYAVGSTDSEDLYDGKDELLSVRGTHNPLEDKDESQMEKEAKTNKA